MLNLPPIPVRANPDPFPDAAFVQSPFVRLESGGPIDVCMQYPLRGLKAAELRCFVREEVRGRLLDAAARLPEGFRIRIWDAWRPLALQRELYDIYFHAIVRTFGLETASREEQKAAVRAFVSEPVPDPALPPVHTTGGAVDVTLLDPSGAELDMGTPFDAFSDLARTAAFENASNPAVRDNRRLLCRAMTAAGFTNLPSEWWHFDFGDRFWAFYNHQPAFFQGIFEQENLHVQ